MSSDEIDIERLFRSAALRAERFRSTAGDRLQRPELSYREIRQLFDEPTPEAGSPADRVIELLAEKAERGLQMAAGPRFFGWVIGSSHPVGVAADMLAGAWGQNCGNHEAAPAASAAEEVAARWLLDLLDLPRQSSVGFVTGGTAANMVGLAAARSIVLERAGWDVEKRGLFGAPPIRVVIGDDAHTTVFFALQLLGLGHDRVVRVATDGAGRIVPDRFREAMAAGDGPSIVVLQAGQLNTGAFDPFAELVPLAREKGAWVHVDGAFGLWARACPEKAALTAGVEGADSWAVEGAQMAANPLRHGLCHRAPPRGAPARDDGGGQLSADGGGRRSGPLASRARALAAGARVRDLGDHPASRTARDRSDDRAALRDRAPDGRNAGARARNCRRERGLAQPGDRELRRRGRAGAPRRVDRGGHPSRPAGRRLLRWGRPVARPPRHAPVRDLGGDDRGRRRPLGRVHHRRLAGGTAPRRSTVIGGRVRGSFRTGEPGTVARTGALV